MIPYYTTVDIEGYQIPILIEIKKQGFYARTMDLNMIPVGTVAESDIIAIRNLKNNFLIIRDRMFNRLLEKLNLETLE